ncbi:MAG: DUF1858 domain-containing protein [Zhengella sp.]|uniref:DUF1858 domain-containing protein n=1 Tax=Zhengella sp. TaxID=2282762 RepID=UPI001DF34FB9|nr:DUF1858 domain-containing protein [Notoacmeibacter sp.]MCC0026058.1 DUF1858 domain-containing protein [Brucellaceae bacterium]
MAEPRRFSTDMTIEEVMDAWPDTVSVVLHHGMFCVGCPIAGFHTVVDAAHEHAVDLERFTTDLQGAIEGPGGKS